MMTGSSAFCARGWRRHGFTLFPLVPRLVSGDDLSQIAVVITLLVSHWQDGSGPVLTAKHIGQQIEYKNSWCVHVRCLKLTFPPIEVLLHHSAHMHIAVGAVALLLLLGHTHMIYQCIIGRTRSYYTRATHGSRQAAGSSELAWGRNTSELLLVRM